MSLIKAKQLDISTLTATLTAYYNNASNETDRNNFVNSIKNSPGFDEKVKASSTDDTPNFLDQKLEGDESSDVVITPLYDAVTKKVKLSGSVNLTNIVTDVVAALIIIQETINIDNLSLYTNDDLNNVTKIFFVVREHSVLFEGNDSDDYIWDTDQKIITFNSPLMTNERIRIFAA